MEFPSFTEEIKTGPEEFRSEDVYTHERKCSTEERLRRPSSDSREKAWEIGSPCRKGSIGNSERKNSVTQPSNPRLPSFPPPSPNLVASPCIHVESVKDIVMPKPFKL
ncbi:hypothetical protein WA158_006366 [Blastocystis sp. Blastoise]